MLTMKNLEKNIKNLCGDKGAEWLHSLPLIIQKLAHHWSLSHIQPVNNMSWNYVAYAEQSNSTPKVLKISCDEQLIRDECLALKQLDGHGVIKLIDTHDEYHAILLERAIPGTLLKDYFYSNQDETIKIYSRIVSEMASCELEKNSFKHVSKWCEAIDRIQDTRVNGDFIDKAKKLRTALLNSMEQEYLCHGDLHLENIIQSGSHWVAIDPKGIIGEIAFEAAAFDLLTQDEINNTATISDKIVHRVNLLATALHIDPDRLCAWIFLRIMISAQWFIEDNGDPSHMLALAGCFYPLLKLENINNLKN